MFVAISISLWDIFGDMGVCFLGHQLLGEVLVGVDRLVALVL